MKATAQTPNTETLKPSISAESEVFDRFEEVAHLINWSQWNHIFCHIEGLSRAQRKNLPEKMSRA